MSEFKVGDCVIVRDDLESVPKEWQGKKGKIVAESVVKATIGVRNIGEGWSGSNSDVFKSHYVLIDGKAQAMPIDEAWLKPCEPQSR